MEQILNDKNTTSFLQRMENALQFKIKLDTQLPREKGNQDIVDLRSMFYDSNNQEIVLENYRKLTENCLIQLEKEAWINYTQHYLKMS